MKSSSVFFVVLLVASVSGCATAVDMDTINSRVDDNTRRIESLERGQEKAAVPSGTAQRLESLQKQVESLQKEVADSRWTLSETAEKLESFQAFMGEVEKFMVQYRKRGGEVDRTLEQLTNRLETDVRSLAEKLRQMLDSGSGN